MKLVDLVGHDKKPQHLPIGSLKGFGTNPYNEPIWRVVWSESRYYLVGANHAEYDESAGGYSNDGTVKKRGKDPNLNRIQACYKWLPLYPGLKRWVLELWKSPVAFTGCSQDQYNDRYYDPASGLLTLGPYPQRGEYCQSFTFPSEPTFSVVEGTINRIRAGWNYTYNDHLAANNAEAEAKQKAVDARRRDIFLDAQQAFKNRASNVRPGKRTKDKINFKKTAADIPINPRGFSTSGRRIICPGL